MEDPTPGEAPGSGDAVPANAGGEGSQTQADATAADDQTIRCDQCGETVPNLTYCVRCGDPLLPEQRKGRAGRVRDTYAAVPGERARARSPSPGVPENRKKWSWRLVRRPERMQSVAAAHRTQASISFVLTTNQ